MNGLLSCIEIKLNEVKLIWKEMKLKWNILKGNEIKKL